MIKNTRLQKNMNHIIALILAVCIILSFYSAPFNTEASSSKATIYVVSKIDMGEKSDVFPMRTFDYNKNGLIKKVHAPYHALKNTLEWDDINYFYKGEKIIKVNISYHDVKGKYLYAGSIDYKLIRNKKGNITGMMSRSSYKDPQTGKTKREKKYKKDKICSYKYDSSNRVIYGKLNDRDGSFMFGFTGNYTYDKNGRIKTHKTTSGDWNIFIKYSYDKQGYINCIYDKGVVTRYKKKTISKNKTTFKNTYKHGRLTKREVETTGTYTLRNTCSKIYYKKITVPKKYEELILKQQKNLIEEYSMGTGIPVIFIR